MKKTNFTNLLHGNKTLFLAIMMVMFAFGAKAQQYVESACGTAFTGGGTEIGLTGDDATVNVALPFTFQFYGVNQTSVNICTNGFMTFTPTTIAGSPFTNAALAPGNNGIFPYWDDLNGAPGVFTATSGVAPNRVFTVRWEKPPFTGTGIYSFEVKLYETTNEIQFIYNDVTSQTGGGAGGASATIGVAGPAGFPVTQHSFNTNNITNGQCISFNYVLPTCTLDCPADIQVNNDPGVCGAFIDVDPPVIGNACAGSVTLFNDNFNVNSGWTLVPLAGAQNWILGPDATNEFTSWAGNLLYFSDDDAGNGVNNIVQATSPVINLAGFGQGTLKYDLSYNWLGGTEFLRVEGWNGASWVTLQNFTADVGTTTTPVVQTVDLDAISPALLNANFQIRITYDDGTGNWQWYAAVDNVQVLAEAAPVATNDYNGGTDASDNYPVGTTEVTFTVTDPNGIGINCSFNVTVLDAESATFTNCPANEFTLNLDPGECSTIFSYPLTAQDNCATSPVFFSQNANFQNPTLSGAGSIVCNNGFTLFPTSYLRVFTNTTGSTLTVTGVPARYLFSDPGFAVTANIYSLTGAPSLGNMTLIGSNSAVPNLPAGGYFTVPVNATVAPGAQFVVELAMPLGTVAAGVLIAQDEDGETGPTYLLSPDCATFDLTDMNGIGFAQGALMAVEGTILLNNYPYTQTGGTAVVIAADNSGFSGDLGIGTHNLQFTTTDGINPASVCNITVNVLEYANPLQSMICNDEVQVSLDEDCVLVLGADQILEGGPYGCYDEYTVEMQINGVWVPAVLNNSHVGQTIVVRVTDDNYPAGNSCWGTVVVEDKLIPEISCPDVPLYCNSITTPGTPGVFPSSVSLVPNSPALPTGGQKQFTIPVTSAATSILDFNFSIAFDHSWIGDVTFTLQSPAGTSVTLFDRPGDATAFFGCAQPGGWDFTFDDEATNPASLLENTCPPANGAYQAVGLLSAFDGEDANGDWILTYNDFATPDGGAILNVTFDFLYNGITPGAIATDNCAPPSLTYTDNTTNLTCTTPALAGIIYRTWIATDPSGNSNSCVQTITLARPTVADLTWPHDYDDLDLPSLQCPNADTSVAATGKPQVFGANIVNNSICDVTTSYEDHIHFICAGSYKIVREWEVIFWCTGQIVTHNQLIKVLDLTGPSITGLNDVTISTSAQNCTGSLILPVGTFTDGCSPSNLIVVTKTTTAGTFNPAGTMLTNIPVTDCLGEAIVTYTATDNCGNTSTKTIRITVVDDKIPTPICDEITQVAVNSDCIAVVDAENFDDGSHDNCAIDRFEVARMPSACIPVQTPFAPTVTFNCCDVSDTVQVIVRVYDECGNYNDCMVEVYVEDKEAPICLAPADQTINCDAGYNLWDLEQFGQPVFADNCDILAGFGSGNCNIDTTYTRTWNLDQCQEGVITRRWVVTDPGNLTDACEQHIYVEHVSDFRVCFPADVTFDDCEEDEAGEPQISDDDCELAAVAHDDLVFNIVDTFCYKIQRTWTVVNWCIYDADATNNTPLGIPSGFLCWRDNGDGYFRYTQIIKVLDDVPPTILSTCDDVTFCDYSAEDDVPGNTDYSESCDGYAELILSAHDACSPDANLEYTWRIYAPNNTVTPLYSGTGSNASGEYPYGTYLIKWEVEDGCGNISYCEYNFTINDCKKPSVVCYFGLAAELMGVDTDGNGTADDCMIVIWDTEFLTSWDDNCTPNSQLKLRVQRQSNGVFATVSNPANLGKSVTFTGADYDFYAPQGHAAPVRLWVGDNAGNWDYCETFVTLQNNMGACGPQAAAAIGGTLTTEENETVDQVTVTATNLGTNAVVTDVTSANGEFNVAATIGADYSVSPYRNNDPLNGVTTWDLVLITKHILDVAPLSSPYKLIAADVNNSGAITAYDLVELRKVILHINDNYPNNTAWRFVDANFVFPNASNPWATDFPEIVNIDNIATQVLDADFVALHTGDVNGSVTANILMGNEDRNFNGALVLNAAAQSVKRGETVTMTVNANDFNVQGYQFTLNFDKNALDYTGITAGALNVTADHVGVFEGAITTSWNGTADLKGDAALFTLTFTAKADVELSNVLSISSRITPAEAYSKEGELMDVALTFNNGTTTTSNVFELYQNEPNPFQGITTIGFNLPESGKATLKVYDAAGRVLKSIEREFAKGYNTVQMTKEDLNASGVLYYELSTATESATKKMIIVE
jgi:subtilisin-like proprotein convertase family protein